MASEDLWSWGVIRGGVRNRLLFQGFLRSFRREIKYHRGKTIRKWVCIRNSYSYCREEPQEVPREVPREVPHITHMTQCVSQPHKERDVCVVWAITCVSVLYMIYIYHTALRQCGLLCKFALLNSVAVWTRYKFAKPVRFAVNLTGVRSPT